MPRGLPQVVLILGLLALPATAATALRNDFDGPEVSWVYVPNRFGVRLTKHERVRQDSSGEQAGSEFFRLEGPPGYSGVLLMPIGNAPVIEDLAVKYRLKSSHPGVVPAVRVVFPRVKDPGTGQPLAAVVRGTSRSQGSSEWEQLEINDPITLVRRHARAIGGTIGRTADEREAYVDAVVLIVPCSPRGSQLWVDQLLVEGHITSAGARPAIADPRAQPARALRQIQLDQHGFSVNGRKFYPRIASHNGEALIDLQRLGFNAVAFDKPPTQELLKQAARYKLQVLCPPGPADELRTTDGAQRWDPVIAWLLPGATDTRSLDPSAATVEQIRRADLHLQRPILAIPTEGWLPWSRLADGLIVRSRWTAAPGMLKEVERQFDEARRYAQPGTPLLAAVSVTHSDAFMQQAGAFAPTGTVTPWRTTSKVSAEAEAVATLGACGVWAAGSASLTDNRSHAGRARIGLSRLNIRLALLEPWLRDGAMLGEATAVGSQHSAAIFRKGRTRLLVPRRMNADSDESLPVKYIASGTSESARAYELTPVSLQPTEIVRLAGGARISAQRGDSLLMITADTRAAAEVSARIAKMAGRAAMLEQAMAIAELRHAESHLSPLLLTAGSRSPDAAVLAGARRSISLSKSAQSTRDLVGAYRHARAANNVLGEWNNERVASALRPRNLESSPLANQPATVIDQQRLLDLIQPLARGPNLLPGGNFESHQATADAGWRHVARDASGAASEVTFSESLPAVGQRSLAIRCAAEEKNGVSDVLVEIASPEVVLRAGELVEITGLVRVQEVSERGGLVLSDSLGGEELAIEVNQPTPWRMFRLLRRATTEGAVKLRFAARAPITAGIDGVMIRTIELPSPTKAAVFGAPALQRK